MFLIDLKYIAEINEIDKNLEEHKKFLEKYYKMNKFIVSGRKEPRTGGMILCNAENKEEAEEIIKEDPFYQKQLAEYQIIEFIPTKYADNFKKFI